MKEKNKGRLDNGERNVKRKREKREKHEREVLGAGGGRGRENIERDKSVCV